MGMDASAPGKARDEHTLSAQNKVATSDGRCTGDQLDVETVLIPTASYSTGDESVHLHISTTGDNNITLLPTGGKVAKTEIKDTTPLACVLRETL
jgi:ArsR family metal-binding transcriptional regulator